MITTRQANNEIARIAMMSPKNQGALCGISSEYVRVSDVGGRIVLFVGAVYGVEADMSSLQAFLAQVEREYTDACLYA